MNNESNKQTIIFGKPNQEHFQACIDKLYQNQQQEYEQQSNEQQQNQSSTLLPRLSRLRIAHVGDSMSHDIAGANSVDGIDSIFIIGGIHSEELTTLSVELEESPVENNDNEKNDIDNNKKNGQQQQQQQLPSDKQLKEFFEQKGHTPTHVVPMFQI